MAVFQMDDKQIRRLFDVAKEFPKTSEKAINAVLYEEAPDIITDAITLLMPVSGANWKGKKPSAKHSKSIKERPNERRNLSVVVGTVPDYHYLYFPDDGSNTYRHAGNKQFFNRGGDASSKEIVDRCIARIIGDFEK